jgi:hypothetical protein
LDLVWLGVLDSQWGKIFFEVAFSREKYFEQFVSSKIEGIQLNGYETDLYDFIITIGAYTTDHA